MCPTTTPSPPQKLAWKILTCLHVTKGPCSWPYPLQGPTFSSFSRRAEQSLSAIWAYINVNHQLSSGQQGWKEGASGLSPIHLQAGHCCLKILAPCQSCLAGSISPEQNFVCMHEWTELRGRVHTVGGSISLSHRQFHPSWPMRSLCSICRLVIGVTYHWSLVVCWQGALLDQTLASPLSPLLT